MPKAVLISTMNMEPVFIGKVSDLSVSMSDVKMESGCEIRRYPSPGDRLKRFRDAPALPGEFHGQRSHELIRCLLLGRKAMVNLDSVLKSKDITLLTKVCLVKAMIFPVQFSCSVLSNSL